MPQKQEKVDYRLEVAHEIKQSMLSLALQHRKRLAQIKAKAAEKKPPAEEVPAEG